MKRFTSVRTLSAAALLALVVGAVSAGQADARPKRPADNGVRCSLRGDEVGEPEDIVYYLPGDEVTDDSGQKWKCGADGNWIPVFRPGPPAGVQPAVPLTGGNVR